MAHYVQRFHGDVEALLEHIDAEIIRGSVSASRERGSSHTVGDARMEVRSYERYSAFGGNRVSLCISVLEVAGEMSVSAVTAGGSQALFFKVNTMGEENFLDKAIAAIQSFAS